VSLQACAELVERGDPDRFLATMAAPSALRGTLFPLYAFNVEIARAPWVTQEPMIAEMRLQWWRDALEEIETGGAVRRHEVVSPLAELLDAEACATLDLAVAARRWDIYKDPFEDAAHFEKYLDETSAGVLWTAARLTGARASEEPAVRAWGRALGLVNWFRAVPALEAANRIPLVDGRPEAIRTLAAQALKLPRPEKNAALLPAWQVKVLLKQVAQNPMRVAEGSLGQSEFRKRISLAKAAILGL
jgi:phytoene/squalene synthetase